MAQTTSIKHKGWKWSTADASNPTLVMVLDNTSKAVHITDAADASTDWAVGAASDATVYIHSATTPVSNYLRMSHDGTDATITAYGATAINFGIGATNYLEMTTSALYPTDTNVMALGTASLNFTDIYLDSGGVLYCDGSNAILTMTSSALTITPATTFSAAVICSGTLTVTGVTTLNGSYNVVENLTYFKGTASNVGASIQTDKMLCFRTDNERIYLRSTATDKLRIYCAGTTSDSIIIQAGSAGTGSITLWGYLIPWKTDTDGSTEGQLWFNDSENRFKYYDGSSVLDLVSSTYSKTFILTGYLSKTGEALVMGTTTLLGFRNDLGYPDGVYIHSPAADKLTIHAPSQADDAIRIQTKGATGGITIGGHLIMDGFFKLYRTNSVSATEGDIWYNNNTNTIHFYDGAAEKTIATV